MDPWGATAPFSWPGGSMIVNYDGLILAHFRSEIHDYANHTYLPRGGDAAPTVDNLRQRIQAAKTKTRSRDSSS